MLAQILQAFTLLNSAGAEQSYVARGAKMKCTMGTSPGILNLPLDHGVYAHSTEKPLLNITDAKCGPDANISDAAAFGVCIITGGVCKPIISPDAKWSNGKDNVLIDGQPALLDNATLSCACQAPTTVERTYHAYGPVSTEIVHPGASGGIISITTNGID